MVRVRIRGDGLAPGAQLLVHHLWVAAFADLLVGKVTELVDGVHDLPGGGVVEPDDDAAVALEQPVPAFLLTDVSVGLAVLGLPPHEHPAGLLLVRRLPLLDPVPAVDLLHGAGGETVEARCGIPVGPFPGDAAAALLEISVPALIFAGVFIGLLVPGLPLHEHLAALLLVRVRVRRQHQQQRQRHQQRRRRCRRESNRAAPPHFVPVAANDADKESGGRLDHWWVGCGPRH